MPTDPAQMSEAELDAAVAVEVFGWSQDGPFWRPPHTPDPPSLVYPVRSFQPCQSILLAMLALEEARKREFCDRTDRDFATTGVEFFERREREKASA